MRPRTMREGALSFERYVVVLSFLCSAFRNLVFCNFHRVCIESCALIASRGIRAVARERVRKRAIEF